MKPAFAASGQLHNNGAYLFPASPTDDIPIGVSCPFLYQPTQCIGISIVIASLVSGRRKKDEARVIGGKLTYQA